MLQTPMQSPEAPAEKDTVAVHQQELHSLAEIPSESSATSEAWPSLDIISRQQTLQMLPSQSPPAFYKRYPQQQQQQQQQQQSCGLPVELAQPFWPMLVGSPPASPVMEPHRQSGSHRRSEADINFSPNQTREGEGTQAVLLPLLDAANFITEPADFQVACSESPSISVAASMYMSCLQPWGSQEPVDCAIQCQPLQATNDPQEAPHHDSQEEPNYDAHGAPCHDPQDASHHNSVPPSSSGIPFPSHDSLHRQPHTHQQMLHPLLHSLQSLQPASHLHSFQQHSPEIHITLGTQQSTTHISDDALHQQMSHDVHRSHVTHMPCDDDPSTLTHSGQPATNTLHMPVQAGRRADHPSGVEQCYATAGPSAMTGAAIGLHEGLWPVCQSSISADSRQSSSPGPDHKRKRPTVEAGADDEAKAELRRARNREAARKTRTKRLDAIATLSEQVQSLSCINQELSLQLQQATCQAEVRGQEAKLLRGILMAHAQDLTEAENINEEVCKRAKDLLQLLAQNHS